MSNKDAIEELATKLHQIYMPDDKTCSYTEHDWKAAKMIQSLHHQPPQGEFTKKMRAWLDKHDYAHSRYCNIGHLAIVLEEACSIIDAAEEEKFELTTRLETSRKLGQGHKQRELANAEKCNEYYAKIKALEDELAEKQELIDGLCSQEPCPKCGYGVTGACYGCEIKRLQAEQEKLKEFALKLVESEEELKDLDYWAGEYLHTYDQLSQINEIVDAKKRLEDELKAIKQRPEFRAYCSVCNLYCEFLENDCKIINKHIAENKKLQDELAEARKEIERLKPKPPACGCGYCDN